MLGAKIKTRCGSQINPIWEYGKVAEVSCDKDGVPLYKIVWNNGGYDYLYDFEFERV
jgi:hypothetical protein